MKAGSRFLFVHLDIIEQQHVGDAKAPVLRIINTDNDPNYSRSKDTTTLSFKHLEYRELSVHNLHSIRVEIRNERGELVPFLGTGQVAITLAFVKWKPTTLGS